MCASADGLAATHFSTNPQRCVGDLSWTEEVDQDVDSEEQPGKDSEIIGSLLLLQEIWPTLSSEQGDFISSLLLLCRIWSSLSLEPSYNLDINV